MMKDKYLSRIASIAPRDHPIQSVILGQFAGSQRVHFAGGSKADNPDLSGVIQQQYHTKTENSVCIIENISPEWIATLGEAWNLDPTFFIDNASRPSANGVSLWEDVMESEIPWDQRDDRIRANLRPEQHLNRRQCHIKGVLHHLRPPVDQPRNRFNRRFEYSDRYGWQSHTLISYCRVSKHLYLILVDSPLLMDDSKSQRLLPSKLSLWVPYSNNRGVPIPQLYENDRFSMFDCLQDCFRHPWQKDILFSPKEDNEAINFICLSYFVLSSLWETNRRYLNQEIKKIAFKDIRKPTVKINNRLHDLRHDLDTLRSEVLLAKNYLIPDVVAACSQLRPYKAPMDVLEEVYAESANLERFLMDTFQLLMSSISVQDAQTSIEDAKRSSILTQLATIYVPLSFVTGVFGMNVREINDSPRSIWIFVVTLLVVGMITVGLLGVSRYAQDHGGWRSVIQKRQRDTLVVEKVRGEDV